MTVVESGVELHFHALPGVDDGPATLAESLELVSRAVAKGTTAVVVTPHVRTDFVTDVLGLAERFDELTAAVAAAGLDVRLHRGGELGHDMVGRLSQAELASIAQGPPGARWLLVETPFEGIGDDFHAATDELRDRGFGILVAHPERSADVCLDSGSGLRRELDAGALAQVNAQSITGAHGSAAREAALDLIGRGAVSVVASDAHGPTRPPLLGEARAHLVEQGIDPVLCRTLTGATPRRLLARGIARAAAVAA